MGRDIVNNHRVIFIDFLKKPLHPAPVIQISADLILVLAGVDLISEIAGGSVSMHIEHPPRRENTAVDPLKNKRPRHNNHNVQQRDHQDHQNIMKFFINQGNLNIRDDIDKYYGQYLRIYQISFFKKADLQTAVCF